MRVKTLIIILLFILPSLSFALDSLEVLMTFEMPEDSVYFSCPQYGGDFNNDGYDDLIHPYFNRFTWNSKLQFYLGSPDPEPVPDLEFEIDSYLPGWPSWSGDINGDGYKDLVLNVNYDAFYPGDIYLFFGGDSITFNPNSPDIIFYGNDYAPDPTGLLFSGSNRDVDFNGDGYADIIAGGRGPDFFFNGQIDLFFGGDEVDTIPDFHIQGAMGDEFGLYNTVGDINGDGYDDLIASRNTQPFEGPFKYEIYFGGSNMDTVKDYEIDGLHYFSLASTIANGDINGDGFDDLIISGGIIYLGRNDGNIIENYILPLESYPSNVFYCNINNDEFTDIAIAVRNENKVYIYYGSDEFDTNFDIILHSDNPEGYFGEYGCNLGDFNGDGKNEIIIDNGSPHNIATVYTLADSMSVVDNSHNKENNNLVISSYPNPFKKTIAISISLSHSIIIQLDIYNILGQKVKSIYNKRIERGDYVMQWDGRDNHGRLLANGIYFARLKIDNSVVVKKIVKIGY